MKKTIMMLAFAAVLSGLTVASCSGGGNYATAQSSGDKKGHSDKGKKGKKDGKKEKGGGHDASSTGGAGVRILERWDMPANLTEISGIALISPTVFACVQDEAGEIFLYNTATRRVEKSIRFAGPGDYEGIAVVGTTAWVLRADGLLFEVQNFAAASPIVTEHSTSFTAAQDVEGLCLDEKHNRLLLAVKGKDPVSKDYRGVYPFDLASKRLLLTPVAKLDAAGGKGKNSGVQPSDIELHPRTGELYILDGPSSGLLILGPDGVERAHLHFSKQDFPQPEGIAITAAGDLYISNEGGKGTGTILKVALGAQ